MMLQWVTALFVSSFAVGGFVGGQGQAPGFSAPPPMGAKGPSVAMMAGLPLEDPDMTPGTISVRVVGQGLDDPVEGASVTLHDARSGRKLRGGSTDSAGRAALDARGLEGRTLFIRAEQGAKVTQSRSFLFPKEKALRFLLALSVPHDVDHPPVSGGRKGEDSGLRKEKGPSRTALWFEFRVRAVEVGKLVVTLTYLLDIAKKGDVGGALLPFFEGFAPMGQTSLSWVVRGDRGLVVQRDLAPGRYSVSVTGTVDYDGDTLVVGLDSPVPVRGLGVVLRRYGGRGPSVVGPGIVRRDMPGAFVVYAADHLDGRHVRFALVGLPLRSRWWAWVGVAIALALVLGALIAVWKQNR